MRATLAATFTVLFLLPVFAQDTQKPVSAEDERVTKKRILVHDFENRIRKVQFSPVRSMVRYELAAWLWKDGRDEIGRAEELAMAAAEDLLEHKAEIPSVYFSNLFPKILSLLQRYAPISSNTLKKKYDLSDIGESGLLNSMLDQMDGEKSAVDRAIQALKSGDTSGNNFFILLDRLQTRQSPEYGRLVNAILAAEETRRIRIPSNGLLILSNHFDPESADPVLVRRFVTIIVNRANLVAQDHRAEIGGFIDLLDRNLEFINNRLPELSPSANTARAILSSRMSQTSREDRERNERIANSADKIAALVAEAERAEDVTLKNALYLEAARIALREKRLSRAILLVHTTESLDLSKSNIPKNVFADERNQLLVETVKAALDSNDVASAIYGIQHTTDPIRKTELFTLMSKFYSDKGDRGEALSYLAEAIKTTEDIVDLSRRSSALIRILPVAKKLDAARVFEINRLAAKAINGIPSLEPKDTPRTENYQNYVTKVMVINWNLLPLIKDLAKTDGNGAADLVGRIERKEIKIVGDLGASLNDFQ